MQLRMLNLLRPVLTRFMTIAALLFPTICIASKIEIEPALLTTVNSSQWALPNNISTERPLNVDINLKIDGQHYEIQTQGVNINNSLWKVDGINHGGDLRLSKTVDDHNTTLFIKSTAGGELRYQYWVNGTNVKDQAIAQQFLGQVLNHTLGSEQQFRQQVEQTVTKALRNTKGYVTQQNEAITQMMTHLPTFNPAENLQVTGARPHDSKVPFVFWGLIISGPNVASIDQNGLVTLKTTRVDGVVLKTYFNLDGRKELQDHLRASGLPYVAGETEKAMMERVIFQRFIQPQHGFSWVLKKGLI